MLSDKVSSTDLPTLLQQLRADGTLDKTHHPETREELWKVTGMCATDVSQTAANLVVADPTIMVKTAIVKAVVDTLTARYTAQGRAMTRMQLAEHATLVANIGWMVEEPTIQNVLQMPAINVWKSRLLPTLLTPVTSDPDMKLIENGIRKFLKDRLGK